MQIKTITSQHRRDFYAVFSCEHCQHEETRSGYDDAFFHNQVIPQMQCKNCGKTASDDYRALTPKHAETDVV